MKVKAIKDMSKKELEKEFIGVTEHIEHMSFGSYELNYQQQLENEIAKRGYEIRANYKLVK